MTPLDGTAVLEVLGVVANLEATTANSIPVAAAFVLVNKESWVDFVPTADVTIATTNKNMWARLVFSVVN